MSAWHLDNARWSIVILLTFIIINYTYIYITLRYVTYFDVTGCNIDLTLYKSQYNRTFLLLKHQILLPTKLYNSLMGYNIKYMLPTVVDRYTCVAKYRSTFARAVRQVEKYYEWYIIVNRIGHYKIRRLLYSVTAENTEATLFIIYGYKSRIPLLCYVRYIDVRSFLRNIHAQRNQFCESFHDYNSQKYLCFTCIYASKIH